MDPRWILVGSAILCVILSGVILFLVWKAKTPACKACACNCEECKPCPTPSLSKAKVENDKCPECKPIFETERDFPIFLPLIQPIIVKDEVDTLKPNFYIEEGRGALVSPNKTFRLQIKNGFLKKNELDVFAVPNMKYLFMNPNGQLQLYTRDGALYSDWPNLLQPNYFGGVKESVATMSDVGIVYITAPNGISTSMF